MREIQGSVAKGNFPPMVGLRKIGSFVKGKVIATGVTAAKNPVVTLELLDLDGSTSVSVSKGVYEEVEVNQGDEVQLVGSLTDLREKLPQLEIGNVITVTHVSNVPSKRGQPKQIFKITVED